MEVDSSSDSEDMEDQMQDAFSNTPQDIQNRRNLRKKYRENIADLVQNREMYIHEDGKLFQKMEDQNKLYKDVKNPREAVVDAELLRHIATVGRERAQHIPVNLVQFLPGTYAEKLVTHMRQGRSAFGEGDEPLLREEWASFGQKCMKYFRRVPTFHYIFGSFERGEVELKQRNPRVSRKDKEGPVKAVAPKELSSASTKKEGQESTIEEIERVFGHLRRIHENNDRDPICYFEFVINPNSFSLTIENIFHVSFLIRDKHAKVYLDDDGLPVIEPVEKGKDEASSSKQKRAKQMAIDMTVNKWKDIVETFNIKRPLIPPRT